MNEDQRLIAELQKQVAELTATLHQRENEITALLGVPPLPVIARYDQNLRHTYVHTSTRLATGIPPEAYLGKTSREMDMPAPAIDLWEDALRRVFATATAETVDHNIDVQGRTWTFQSRVVPEVDERGQTYSVITVTRNITDEKDAHDTLLEHKEILETVGNLGRMLSAELDLRSLVQTVTDAATEISRAEFGAFFYNLTDEQGESYTLYTISGVPHSAFSKFPMPRNTHLFGPTFRGEGTVRIADVKQDERYGKNDPYFGMPAGHLPVTSYLAVPVVSRSGEVLGGLFFGHSQPGIFTNRDERIIEGMAAQTAIAMDNARLYDEAREQRERLRITISGIGDAVIATDNRGAITFMNPIAQNLTGWPEKEAVGKTLEQVFRIVNEFTRETAESPVDKVLRDGQIVGLANHTILLARDGREIPIDDSGAPIFDHTQRLVGVILVFRDITERRKSERRIKLLLELSDAFSQALTPNQVADVIVEKALTALDAKIATVSLLSEDGTTMEVLNLHGLPPEVAEQYRSTPLDYPGPLNDAVRMGEIVWIASREEYVTLYPHFETNIINNKTHSAISIPIEINDTILGGFSLSFTTNKPFDAAEAAFFKALAQQCAQSLERARFYEEAKDHAAFEERQRLARDLHDAVSQVLFSSTSMAETVLLSWERNPQKALEQLQKVVTLNRAAMAEMRSLLLELKPETIIRTELDQLFEQLLKAVKGRKVIETELLIEGEKYKLPEDVHVGFYRIAQEALNNVVKHSGAARTNLSLRWQPDQITLIVNDQGQGFDMEQESNGMGQGMMRERARSIDADLNIASEPGKGTTVTLTWQPPIALAK